MTDTRRLQRALFRMQVDAGFGRAVLAGEARALASTGLAAADLALLMALDPAGIAADPGGRRRLQIAGNAASEYAATLACAEGAERGARLLEGFLSSPELHAALGALAADGRLPLAFGDWAARCAREWEDRVLGALARLEHALCAWRRAPARAAPPPRQGEVRLAERTRLIEAPAGTLEHAEALRAARAAELPAPVPPARLVHPDGAVETLLLHARAPDSPHRLPDVHVELVEPPADLLLRRAELAMGAAERARFARAHGAEPAELEGFLADWIEEGILLRGS